VLDIWLEWGEALDIHFRILVRGSLENVHWKTDKKWQDNINLDLRKIGCEDRRWMEMAEDCIQ